MANRKYKKNMDQTGIVKNLCDKIVILTYRFRNLKNLGGTKFKILERPWTQV